MDGKKAFVFDTNFIIQNKDLDKVVSDLQDSFTVYVTQVSIKERIAQQCRELKDKYDRFPTVQEDYIKIAKINVLKSYEENAEEYRIGIQTNYDRLFGPHIIPFLETSELFSEVLDRAFKKLPPFLNMGNASDKGFKDSLIWLSMLSYFKENGEDTVLFVSSDNGFKSNADMLCKEFKEVTGKMLEIRDNSYYKSITGAALPEKEQAKREELPDTPPRERIRNTIEALCGIETEDSWGNPDWERTFITSEKVDADYMKIVFDSLKNNILNHIFDESVPAYDVLALDDRITNGNVDIPIVALENAMRLHDDIKVKYPDFINQFYSTSANIINWNYIAQLANDDDEVPF